MQTHSEFMSYFNFTTIYFCYSITSILFLYAVTYNHTVRIHTYMANLLLCNEMTGHMVKEVCDPPKWSALSSNAIQAEICNKHSRDTLHSMYCIQKRTGSVKIKHL